MAGNCCKAQYTEVKALQKESVFTPLTIANNSGIPIKLKVIPADFYSSKLGFFCQQEWKLEKTTAIPFKIRLGSVAEVDRMEGKPNTRFVAQ